VTGPRGAAWPRDAPWTLAVIALAVIATAGAFASPACRDALVADARIFDGQLWRALAGPLVHATWGHLVRDLALIAIAGLAYEGPLRAYRPQLFAGGLIAPALAVLVATDLRWYCGLSGLSHALLAAALAYEAVRRRGPARLVAIALAAVAAPKPLYELATGGPAFAMSLGAGVRQVPLAHLVGVCVGLACGLAAGVRATGPLDAQSITTRIRRRPNAPIASPNRPAIAAPHAPHVPPSRFDDTI
jgi:rhomboid family GlyGly-CTERM serine protease